MQYFKPAQPRIKSQVELPNGDFKVHLANGTVGYRFKGTSVVVDKATYTRRTPFNMSAI